MKPIVKTALQKTKYKNIFIMSFGEILELNSKQLRDYIIEKTGESFCVNNVNYNNEFDFKLCGENVVLVDEIVNDITHNTNYYKKVEQKNGVLFAKKLKQKNVSLLKQIDLRNETIFKIVNCIVNVQKKFILNMDTKKPLTLEDISNHVGYSISCVSRGIKNKKININGKIIYVKDLLCKKTKTGESKEQILKMINNILEENENISSAKISTILKNNGILIARRTVSNYINKLKENNNEK